MHTPQHGVSSGPGQVYPDKSPGPLPKDPWEIEFHWATAGAAVPGFWIVDAWLASATFGGNLHVPSALVLPQAVPPAGNQRYAHIVLVPAGAVPLPPFVPPGEFLTARLYRLYTVLRFVDTANSCAGGLSWRRAVDRVFSARITRRTVIDVGRCWQRTKACTEAGRRFIVPIPGGDRRHSFRLQKEPEHSLSREHR